MKCMILIAGLAVVAVLMFGCQKKEANTLSITAPSGETAAVTVK